MHPQEMTALLISLSAAADIIEAIDNPEHQDLRGWDLEGWSYTCIPWGVAFLRHGHRGAVTGSILAVTLSERQRAALPAAYTYMPWPTRLLLLG